MKAVTRKSFKAVADYSWGHHRVNAYLKRKMCMILKKEIKSLQADLTLHHSDPGDMLSFTWEQCEQKMKESAPILYNIFSALTDTRMQGRINQR